MIWIVKPGILKGQPGACRSREGSDHFRSYVYSLSLYFCKRLFLGHEPMTSFMVTRQQLYHCARAGSPSQVSPQTTNFFLPVSICLAKGQMSLYLDNSGTCNKR
jgi:hypothetical protein